MKIRMRQAWTLALFFSFVSVGCAPSPQQAGKTGRSTSPSAPGDGNQQTPGGQTPGAPDTNLTEARAFYNDKILPAWRNTATPRCMECHDAPRNTIGNPDAADLSIFDFGKMYALLSSGDAPNNNDLFDILIGNTNHPGQRICTSEQDTQCKLAIDWWMVAFSTSGGGAFSLGQIQGVSARGQVSGYALDPNDPNATFQVRIYLEGDKDNGQFLTEATANQSTTINGLLKSKGFSYKIPDSMIDNTEKQVYVYAVKGEELVELAESPYTFTAYAPKGMGVAGGTFPNAATGCNCHNFSYDTLYGALISPPPNQGGSATNNILTRMMNGSTSHSGGTNNGIATQSSAWWRCEFENNCG